MTNPKNRHPAGQPTGGRFATQQHGTPELALDRSDTGIRVDYDISNFDGDLYSSLTESGLGGTATVSDVDTVVWESADGKHSLEVSPRDDGSYDIVNLADGDDRTAYTADCLAAEMKSLLAGSAAKAIDPFDPDEAFVSSIGFWNEPTPDGASGQTHVNIDLVARDGGYIDLHYYSGEDRFDVWRDGRLLEGAERAAAAAEICPGRLRDEPDGNPVDRLKWHAQRILGRVAARDDVPDWMREHRVDGLAYEG